MFKKLIFFIVVLVLVGGGFFYWQKNQADVKELNKTLPAGVKVVKSLIGNKYRVVNKIDGYEFKVPKNSENEDEIGKIEYRDLVDDKVGYRIDMDGEIQKLIKLENILSITSPNGFNIIDVISLHLTSDVNLEKFVEDFQSKFTPTRSGKTIEITSRVDDFSRGNFNILKLSEINKYLRTGKEDVTPLFYLLNNGSTVIHIIPVNLRDDFINKVILNGKW